VFCGDFNSLPLIRERTEYDSSVPPGGLVSGVYSLLSKGFLATSHPHHPAARRGLHPGSVTSMDLPMRFTSAYAAALGREPLWTNWHRHDFRETLDYVWVAEAEEDAEPLRLFEKVALGEKREEPVALADTVAEAELRLREGAPEAVAVEPGEPDFIPLRLEVAVTLDVRVIRGVLEGLADPEADADGEPVADTLPVWDPDELPVTLPPAVADALAEGDPVRDRPEVRDADRDLAPVRDARRDCEEVVLSVALAVPLPDRLPAAVAERAAVSEPVLEPVAVADRTVVHTALAVVQPTEQRSIV
jgi:hypothetical protein